MIKVLIVAMALALSGCDIVGSAVLSATTNSFPLLWN